MFESARLKIERADHHINDLQRQFDSVINDSSHELRIEINPDTRKYDIRVSFKPISAAHLALIVGDAIHNLRTALDHMTWELVGAGGGTQDRYLKFPSCAGNRIDYESACQGIKTPNQSVRDLFKAMEAFPTGKGHSLYVVHELDNIEKHKFLMPVFRVVQVPSFSVFNPDGSPYGRFRAHYWGSGTDDSFFLNLPKMPNILPGSALQVDDDAHPFIGAFFGDAEPVRSQPVIETLRKLRHATSEAIDVAGNANLIRRHVTP